MKKILPIVFALSILTSCGPRRLSCGPRGICKAPHHLKKMEIKQQNIICYNGN
ncbi:hypothetical protein FLAK523_01490 [Flavobacterium sp. K5-23]|nr:hypothetical protein FLAK523_01490 [Flavobacterium sp. K5-23]